MVVSFAFSFYTPLSPDLVVDVRARARAFIICIILRAQQRDAYTYAPVPTTRYSKRVYYVHGKFFRGLLFSPRFFFPSVSFLLYILVLYPAVVSLSLSRATRNPTLDSAIETKSYAASSECATAIT